MEVPDAALEGLSQEDRFQLGHIKDCITWCENSLVEARKNEAVGANIGDVELWEKRVGLAQKELKDFLISRGLVKEEPPADVVEGPIQVIEISSDEHDSASDGGGTDGFFFCFLHVLFIIF